MISSLARGVGLDDLERSFPSSATQACVEESADGFESTCASCLQPFSFPSPVFPKLLCPPLEFAFLALPSFLSPASELGPAEMSLLEGAARRKLLAVGI